MCKLIKYTHAHSPLGRINASGMNDYDDRAGLRGYVQFNKYTHTHIHYSSRLVLVLLCGGTLVTGSLIKPLSTVYSINKSVHQI